jgi:hypothetical protein
VGDQPHGSLGTGHRREKPPLVRGVIARGPQIRCLETPNDLLLRPEHLQYLTRALLARGWAASDTAALVRAVYEADHGWRDRWARMHPRTRAEFDVRIDRDRLLSRGTI